MLTGKLLQKLHHDCLHRCVWLAGNRLIKKIMRKVRPEENNLPGMNG